MKKSILYFGVIATLFFQFGCANIKLVSTENNELKFCTNPNNRIAKESDFDEAAAQRCEGKVKFLRGGEEFFSDPKNPKIFGILEVQKEVRQCRVYQCSK